MAMRVAVGSIIVGHGDSRKTIKPNERFDSTEHGISDETLARWEAAGTVRKLRDQTTRAPVEAGPVRAMAEGGTVEDRSGPVANVTSDMPNKMDQGKVVEPAAEASEEPVVEHTVREETAHHSRRRRSHDDEL